MLPSAEPLDRRTLLAGSVLGLGVIVAGSSAPFSSAPQVTRMTTGYGPVRPVGELLALPEGFSYTVLAETGSGAGGYAVGADPDGMGCFPGPDGGSVLVCNHELGASDDSRVPHEEGLVYDRMAKGGTSTLVLAAGHDVLEHYTSLSGTVDNCAGGVTPWGTWLTCEEAEQRAGTHEYEGRTYTLEKDHGYVFEVDPTSRAANVGTSTTPLKFLGRFRHEAVTVDPTTGRIYLTEDAAKPNGFFYRWTPPQGYTQGKGALHALAGDGDVEVGTLEALVASELDGRHVTDLSLATETGTTYQARWVEIPDRDARDRAVRIQLGDEVVTRGRKLEGQWWGDDGVYFVSSFARTEDGSVHAHDGQVWFLDPREETLTLTTIFAAETGDVVNGPDNITVSPHGGLVLAEDGDGASQLIGVTAQGRAHELARTLGDDGEWAGPCFSADGTTLFANVQGDPGRTFAITGPWGRPPRPSG